MKKMFLKTQSGFTHATAGFTLIELLVVIAIIAILSTIVLASLGTARQRARDTRAKSELSQMRAQAELYSSGKSPNSYTGVCGASKTDAPPGLKEMITSVKANVVDNAVDCNVSTDGFDWAVAAKIKGDAKEFCADSTGYAGFSSATALLGTGTICTPE